MRRLQPTLLSTVALGLILVCAIGCAGGGGKPNASKNVLLTSDFDDADVGAEAAKGMAAQMGIVDDPQLQTYIETIGRRMLPFAPTRAFDYTFHIIDQSAPNAFALPGGYIYISRGLLTLVNSEDELACVIGHEITHAAERHAASRQQFSLRLSPLSVGFMRAGSLAAYGRDQERDADRGGQILAAKAGWNPAGMATFMQDMGAMDRLTVGWSRLPGFFDSHPTSPQRAAASANRAENLTWTPRPNIAPDPHAFLAHMEGLTLGADPKQGIFEGSRFLHRDMNFSLLFPDGWELINKHDVVGAIAPLGKAYIALRFAGPGDDPRAMAHLFIESELRQERGRVRSEQALQVGALPAYRVYIDTPNIQGFVTFIAYDDVVYRLDTVSVGSQIASFDGRGRAVARSFRPLTETEKTLFKVTRLALVQSRGGETLSTLSARTANELDLPTTAVMNDLFLNARLEEGRWIKIGRAEAYIPQEPGAPAADPQTAAAPQAITHRRVLEGFSPSIFSRRGLQRAFTPRGEPERRGNAEILQLLGR